MKNCPSTQSRIVSRERIRSEKNPGQGELQFFDEAELLVQEELDVSEQDAEDNDTTLVAAHKRTKKKNRILPENLQGIDVHHELDPTARTCTDCGHEMPRIGEEVSEQLGVVPQQYFVIRNIRGKYTCSCKACIKSTPMPAQPIPGSQASPSLLAQIMVSKFHDGLPLYRQEKIAARNGLDLPRSKLARWLIALEPVLQPLYNMAQDVFFSYDIALSDDTVIQVLKEDARAPSSKSALWIRRGGPPDKPVVLVDYRQSKSGDAAYSILSEFKGYLVCDAAKCRATNKMRHARQSAPVHRFCGPERASPDPNRPALLDQSWQSD